MVHAYFGKPEYLGELRSELRGKVTAEHGDLLLADELLCPAFALDVWPEAELLPFESISEAARRLKAATSPTAMTRVTAATRQVATTRLMETRMQ